MKIEGQPGHKKVLYGDVAFSFSCCEASQRTTAPPCPTCHARPCPALLLPSPFQEMDGCLGELCLLPLCLQLAQQILMLLCPVLQEPL